MTSPLTWSCISWTAITALGLAGCAVGPDFKEPPWYSPASWFSSAERQPTRVRSEAVSEPVDPGWWGLFGDRELTSLEERVAGGNLDVRTATIQIAQSRAERGVTAAGLYPSLNANASYDRQKASDKGVFSALSNAAGTPGTQAGGLGAGAVPPVNTAIPPFDLYEYGVDATWEIDFWGRVRRSIEAADATIASSEEARRNALLISLAEVASDYVQLRGVQAQEQIAAENVRVAQQSVQLTRDRSAGGLGTELDVANATAQLQQQEAQIPQLQQQEAQLINALSLLLGQQPNALRGELETQRPVPPVPPRVPVGLPSELARRRPDIRQAEAQLHAATANVGVAVASFYPQVTLSASVGIQSLQPKNLWTLAARQYGMGPSVTLPIFQGGQLRSTLHLREAQQQEAAINYEKTVLNAWHDVDNALTAYDKEQRRRDALVQSVAQNQRALSLALDQYRQGLIDYLPVLDTQRSLLQTQQALAQSTTTVSNNLVTLYRALGGGWEKTFPVKATPRRPHVRQAAAS
ncbi:MAG: efflux transporter outer membrane subunit [Acetobacteraceae bacterium]|nr:efflux transporter outer membrane subunit [Acetobacteraceae bacterium]